MRNRDRDYNGDSDSFDYRNPESVEVGCPSCGHLDGRHWSECPSKIVTVRPMVSTSEMVLKWLGLTEQNPNHCRVVPSNIYRVMMIQ
mgnify:CR=1 FL=1